MPLSQHACRFWRQPSSLPTPAIFLLRSSENLVSSFYASLNAVYQETHEQVPGAAYDQDTLVSMVLRGPW